MISSTVCTATACPATMTINVWAVTAAMGSVLKQAAYSWFWAAYLEAFFYSLLPSSSTVVREQNQLKSHKKRLRDEITLKSWPVIWPQTKHRTRGPVLITMMLKNLWCRTPRLPTTTPDRPTSRTSKRTSLPISPCNHHMHPSQKAPPCHMMVRYPWLVSLQWVFLLMRWMQTMLMASRSLDSKSQSDKLQLRTEAIWTPLPRNSDIRGLAFCWVPQGHST